MYVRRARNVNDEGRDRGARPPLSRAFLVLALVVVALATFIRFRVLDVPLERDEAEYGYTARLLLEGIPPYRESVDPKMPGLHVLYAVFLRVFGDSAHGIRLGLFVASAFTTLVIFLLGRSLFDVPTGAAAAGFHSLLAESRALLGFTANAEHFVVAAAVVAALLLVEGIGRDRRALVFAGGIAAGAAFVIKQPGGFFGAFGVLCCLLAGRQAPPATRLARAAVFAAGALLPLALVSLWLLRAGVFDQFLEWTVFYAADYTSSLSVAQGMRNFLSTFSPLVALTTGTWVLAAFGVVAASWREPLDQRIFALAFAAASILAVLPGFYFRHHYYILAAPAAGLLAAVGLRGARALLPARAGDAVAIALFAAATGQQLWLERDYFFGMSPEEISRQTYGANPFVEANAIAARIREVTAADDRIAVLGSEPEIYFYAKRRAATRHIVMYPLTLPGPTAERLQHEMVAELEAANPKLVVFVSLQTSWLLEQRSPRTILSWYRSAVPARYRRIGLVDLGRRVDQFHWGEGRAAKPRNSKFIEVWLRKESLESSSFGP